MQPALFDDEPRQRRTGAAGLGFTQAAPDEPAPTVVALHGGLVGGRLTFGPVLASWSRRLRVLVPDRRGFERTPAPADGSIEEQAQDLLAFVDEHAAGRAHVVGASFGGVVALTALQLDPGAFRSLTLLEAPAISLAPGTDEELARWRSELQRTWERIDDEPEPVLRRFLARTDPGSLDALLRLLAAGDPGITPKRDELRPWRTPLRPEGVRSTDVPALVASGQRSAPVFRRIGDHVAEVLRARHLVVEGAGHAVHLAGRRLLDPLRAHIAAAEAQALHHDPVRLVAHDPSWGRAFAAERDAVAGALGHRALAIEHVGSTAVPGLAAKPVVDVLVALDALTDADDVVARLEASGYAAWPAGDTSDHRFLLRAADGVRRFHVHLVARGSPRWRDTVAFRDALRGDASLRERYTARKRALAAAHGDDREAYTAGKTAFVAQALSGASGRT
jgi:GrpB-like predicted nucleotidyltransferase (UPF0157 family)/pimeloyl-ACP methyl ester carboxylesterase